MFRAELTCKSCEFTSEPFMIGYFPPCDSVDFVFQNVVDSCFRIVPCEGISRRAGSTSPTEEDLDAVIGRLGLEIRREHEELLDVWVAPDEFISRVCPKCGQRAVTLRLLSVL